MRKMLLKSGLCLAAAVSILTVSASAAVPYDTYTYSASGEVTLTAHAYVPRDILENGRLGWGGLDAPKDLFIGPDGYIYVADTGHNRVLVLDDSGAKIREVTGFEQNGEFSAFSAPTGIFVTREGILYVADTGNARVVAVDSAGRALRVLGRPDTALLESGYPYRPVSVAVDAYGRVFTVAANVTLGIIVFDAKDAFQGFLGAQRVTYNLTDYLWKRFITAEQKNRMRQFVPTEYSRLEIDADGFVYAVSAGYDPAELDAAIRAGSRDGRVTPIRKLNPSGYDVLKRQGMFAPVGDIVYGKDDKGQPLVSTMADVALGPAGTYSLLDVREGRLFTYSRQGELLFAFGAMGTRRGTSQYPAAIAYRGSDLFVLDTVSGNITVFERTAYGSLLIETQERFNDYDYAGAAEVWRQVIQSNPNLDMAYTSIGQTLLRQKDYAGAMDYFKISNNRELYSEAWSGQRGVLSRRLFIPLVFGAVLVILLLGFGLRRIARFNRARPAAKRASFLRGIAYGFYAAAHPFDGFWDLKHERRGGALPATAFYLLALISDMLVTVCSAYLFSPASGATGAGHIFFRTTGLALLFVLANWCLSTLLEGEGTLRDTYINVGYALLPLILFNLFSVPLSYALIQGEGMYISFMHTAGIVWTVGLIFIGVLVAQQYAFLKNTVVCIFSVAGMAVILFIFLLCISMYTQIFQFLNVVFFEIFKR